MKECVAEEERKEERDEGVREGRKRGVWRKREVLW